MGRFMKSFTSMNEAISRVKFCAIYVHVSLSQSMTASFAIWPSSRAIFSRTLWAIPPQIRAWHSLKIRSSSPAISVKDGSFYTCSHKEVFLKASFPLSHSSGFVFCIYLSQRWVYSCTATLEFRKSGLR